MRVNKATWPVDFVKFTKYEKLWAFDFFVGIAFCLFVFILEATLNMRVYYKLC